ncbi:MAG: 50S ribosomal protein L21 [Candidatus Eisenbacteria bacterium]
MYAIVEQGGFQFRVTQGAEIEVPRLDAEIGEKVTISRVLLIENDGGDRAIGTPVIENASAECEVVAHGKGDKVLVQKFKRRKNYRRIHGHRTHFTRIRVLSIGT